MTCTKKIFLFCAFYLIACVANAQDVKDAGMWATFTIQKKINKRVTLVVDQELRLRENFQRINLFYTNIGVDYKANKWLKVSPTYRAIQKKRFDGTFSYRHRLMLDLTLKKKFQKITLSERVRYQIEVQDLYTSKKGKLPEQFLRLKTDLKYNLNDDVTPYISCELRYQIHSPRGDGPVYDYGFHRIRNVAGIEYQINKSNSINLYYLIQSEFNISDRESIYILGLAYTLTL
ncbi:MAG: DUF2490 domain-containing protein [Bacteroidetes bacterium]|nr:DUF2490 domain-containing protein [Bacteroidota bacterium]